ncbi:MAG: phosphate/phosphite/phosphonate ABC transporter substrate-binding protein [Campylobacterota bacterium]|nr:phosphate/phosphite/phosphonate ABC transporter substrate-binding protein [Campylobacterota bacterium]
MSDSLSFGAISTVNKTVMEKKLTPLIKYISNTISKDLKFKTGFDYADTIEQFRNSNYDLGFIGPSPFIIATHNIKGKLKIIAGLNNKHYGQFRSVIIVRKDSKIEKLSDLKGKSFAFGSPQSTLSYYMPMNILQKNNIDKELIKYDFLGKHDRIAKYIIMGKYDAGGIKASVAKKYSKYLKIIYMSELVPDFIIVASAKMPDNIIKKIQKALLKPEASKIAQSIKPSATGFRLREYKDYDHLKKIMIEINPNALK